jgi:hypothetical protein
MNRISAPPLAEPVIESAWERAFVGRDDIDHDDADLLPCLNSTLGPLRLRAARRNSKADPTHSATKSPIKAQDLVHGVVCGDHPAISAITATNA